MRNLRNAGCMYARLYVTTVKVARVVQTVLEIAVYVLPCIGAATVPVTTAKHVLVVPVIAEHAPIAATGPVTTANPVGRVGQIVGLAVFPTVIPNVLKCAKTKDGLLAVPMAALSIKCNSHHTECPRDIVGRSAMAGVTPVHLQMS